MCVCAVAAAAAARYDLKGCFSDFGSSSLFYGIVADIYECKRIYHISAMYAHIEIVHIIHIELN